MKEKILITAIERAIVDLSVHPAGCDDWQFYEQLCLETADSLSAAIISYRTEARKEKETT